MKKLVIYKITNIINDKFYVGSTSNFNNRRSTHVRDLKFNRHVNDFLQNAWNKYGEESFKFEIIEEILDKSRLIEREQFYLDNLKSYDRKIGYNISEKSFGGNQGLEANKRISEALKGRKFSKEHRIKIGLKHKGKIISEESKQKMSKSHKGLIPWNKGIGLSKETKKRISKSLKGRIPWNKKFLNKKQIENIKKLYFEEKIYFTNILKMFKIGKTALIKILTL